MQTRRRTDREPAAGYTPRWRAPRTLVAAALLVVITAAAFSPLRHADFVTIDDPEYVTANPHVLSGLSWSGVEWAVTSRDAANWHPLTWLSHMLDVTLFGLDAGAHHVVNVLFHAMAALLLFAFLFFTTGYLARSWCVAALFAVHPLHVESVAWIAERKDVLSAVFWMATLLAYAWHARQPSQRRYTLTLALFALGLMAKPMLVTLPFVLLLLDVWPLRRLGERRMRPPFAQAPLSTLLLEKLPLLALSVASSWITLNAQAHGGAVIATEALPVSDRLANGVVTIVRYLGKTIWPSHLSVFYPHPHSIPAIDVAGAVVVIAAISIAVVVVAWQRPARSYLAVGWYWFLGTLVPVVGLVQVGAQGMADRYTYLPLVGVFFAAVWGMGDVIAKRPAFDRPALAAAGAAIALCAWLSHAQAAVWLDSGSLWAHALEADPNNYRAHNALGVLAADRGDSAGALRHFEAAASLEPGYADAQNNLGLAFANAGRFDEAIARYRSAIDLKPEFAEPHANLGMALLSTDHPADAVRELSDALRLNGTLKDGRSHLAQAEHALGLTFARDGQIAQAIPHLVTATRLDPGFAEAHGNLGAALLSTGRPADAVPELTTAMRLRPGYDVVQLNLARAFAALDRRDDAIRELDQLLARAPGFDPARQLRESLMRKRDP